MGAREQSADGFFVFLLRRTKRRGLRCSNGLAVYWNKNILIS